MLLCTALRLRRNESRAQVCLKAKIAPPILRLLEAGAVGPGNGEAERLAAALDWHGDLAVLFDRVVDSDLGLCPNLLDEFSRADRERSPSAVSRVNAAGVNDIKRAAIPFRFSQ